MSNTITTTQVAHIAELAHIPVSDDEKTKLATAFTQTLAVIDHLRSVDTTAIEPTHQVTGLENVTREDVVDEQRMFTQQDALANATHTHQGFFVVPRVIDERTD